MQKKYMKNLTPFYDKNNQQTRNRMELVQLDKGLYKNTTGNIMLNG